MATQEELREALEDYAKRGQASERARRSFKGWNCIMHLHAEDVPEAVFTLTIKDGELGEMKMAWLVTPRISIIRGNSEDLANIFWGDENPSSSYMQGAIKVQGHRMMS